MLIAKTPSFKTGAGVYLKGAKLNHHGNEMYFFITTMDNNSMVYIHIIEVARGSNWGNIGLLGLVNKLAKKERDQYSPIWTEQASSIKFLL